MPSSKLKFESNNLYRLIFSVSDGKHHCILKIKAVYKDAPQLPGPFHFRSFGAFLCFQQQPLPSRARRIHTLFRIHFYCFCTILATPNAFPISTKLCTAKQEIILFCLGFTQFRSKIRISWRGEKGGFIEILAQNYLDSCAPAPDHRRCLIEGCKGKNAPFSSLQVTLIPSPRNFEFLRFWAYRTQSFELA